MQRIYAEYDMARSDFDENNQGESVDRWLFDE